MTSRLFKGNLSHKIRAPEHLIHEAADEVDVFVGDLDEAGAGLVEEFAGGEEAVAEVGEVGVDAEFPGVAEGFDLFGFAGEGVVIAVLDGAVVEVDLPVGAVFDAVGGIDVAALDLAGHALALEEGGHDEEGVALDEAVRPAVGVGVVVGDLVEFLMTDGVAEEFRGAKPGRSGPAASSVAW